MKKREKILAGVVFGMVGIFVLGFGIKGFFVKPLREVDKRTAAIRQELEEINKERRLYFEAEDQLKAIARKTFALEVNEALARSGEIITHQIAQAGLNEADFTRLPVGPRRMRGAAEIGWSVQGKGSFERIMNLLFLVQTSPQVHRVEGVTLTAYEKPGEIKLRFVYVTLVIDPAPDVELAELKQPFTLDSPERLAYNVVLERDILRPYIKAPPPAPEPAQPKPGKSTAPPGPETLRVVSLSEWNGVPEVHIRDTAQDKTLQFKAGDVIPENGEVVAVDYRPMPAGKIPGLLSHSRLILKIGDEYWAVERGQTLAEKRKLTAEQWPMR